MEDFSIIKVNSVIDPPFSLNFCDFVNCPVCDYEIDVFDIILDSNTTVNCDACEHTIKFECVKI
ncbi:hypothetical protein [Flavobacterium branchiophilum]|nr:hypothetical protein [Flavobacterium branchiophilum]